MADTFRGTWPATALLRITATAQGKVPRCLSLLARSSILPLWLGSKIILLSTSKLSILNSHVRQASVRHTLTKSTTIRQCKPDMSQVHIQISKFQFCQYQNIAILPNLMPAKFSRYTVGRNLSLYGVIRMVKRVVAVVERVGCL